MQGVVKFKSSYSGERVEFLDLMIGIIIIIIVIFICQVIRCNKNRTNKLTAMSPALGLYTPIIHCHNYIYLSVSVSTS